MELLIEIETLMTEPKHYRKQFLIHQEHFFELEEYVPEIFSFALDGIFSIIRLSQYLPK